MWWFLIVATAVAGIACTVAAEKRHDAQTRKLGLILIGSAVALGVAHLAIDALRLLLTH